MATALKTSTSEIGDSRVRVEVEVPPDTVERELQSAAQQLGREMRIPGFRKGKVPPQMVIRQLGRESVLDEAVRRALPAWYERAVTDAGIAAIGDPKIDLGDLPEKGSPVAFSIEVAVRPKAKLGTYKGLEVGRPDPDVDPAEVDSELDRMRESVASLETVDRPAESGDFVVLDFVGTVDGEPFEGGEARGYLLELGSGRLIPGFEEQLQGASAGDERDVKVTFPDEYQAEQLAGKDAVFACTVQEVKEKRLPELDDEFALEAAGMDTLTELREDIENRLRDTHERTIETQFREAVLDAAVDEAGLDIDHDLIHAKAHEMWHETSRRLQRQGLNPEQYLQFTGKTEEELVHEAEPEAERALKREAVLAAVVDAEKLEVTDDELLEAMREANVAQSRGGQAGPSEKALKKSLDKAREQGRDELLREDIAMRKALDLMVEHATPITVDQAEARGKLWTPEKEKEEGDKQLWTPGS
ncbi:MAG: trigger factor [Thermoleophilaceae bacterium]|jgi:trigger factor|nr:trigger factor [Thermoleophilaceae bacterium]